MQPDKQYHATHPQRLIIDGDTTMYLRHVSPDDSTEVYRLVRSNREHLGRDQQWVRDIDFLGLDRAVQETIRQVKADKCLQYRIMVAGGAGVAQRMVGTVSLFDKQVIDRCAVLACWMAAGDHGNGYATRAVRRLLQYAFREWNVDVVTTIVAEDNTRAQAVVSKLGAHKTDQLSEQISSDGSKRLCRLWEFRA